MPPEAAIQMDSIQLFSCVYIVSITRIEKL